MSLAEGITDLASTFAGTYGYLTAGHAVVGRSHSGTDVDSYRVYLQAGNEYFFYIDGFSIPSPANYNAFLGLFTRTGTLLEVSDGTLGAAETLLFQPTATGFYDLGVFAGRGYGSYYLSYSNLSVADDHDASFSTSVQLHASAPTFGALEYAGDSDGFVLNLVAGKRYYFEYLTAVRDTYVQVVDVFGRSAGELVDESASSGTFVADSTESVMLVVSSNGFRSTGSYYLYAAATYSNTANLVMGGASSEVLTGTPGQDELQGSWGADSLRGNSGNDYLFGGPGTDRDTLNGGAGADLMVGGPGNDIYIVDNAGDRVYEERLPTATGAAGGLDLIQSSVSFTLGNHLEMLTLTGSGAVNAAGNSGANTLAGNGARNVISGGAGNDSLNGKAGDDVLTGGSGRDLLTGGSGSDTFDFNSTSESGPTAADIINDFTRGARGVGDRIDLSGLDANTATAANDVFRFIGSAAFSTSNAAGQLRYAYDRGTGMGMLYASTDADPSAEFAVQVRSIASLAAADFIL